MAGRTNVSQDSADSKAPEAASAADGSVAADDPGKVSGVMPEVDASAEEIREAESTTSTSSPGVGENAPRPGAAVGTPWSTKIHRLGRSLQKYSASVGGMHASLLHISDFLRQMSRYAPTTSIEGECPAMVRWASWACGELSSFLTEAATTVRGLSALGRMIGGGAKMVARSLGALQEDSNEAQESLKICITSADQVADLISSWDAGIYRGKALEVDIDADATPAFVKYTLEVLRFRSPQLLELISCAPIFSRKLSELQ